jgi:imidazolonepropionase-like amidohydrolase
MKGPVSSHYVILCDRVFDPETKTMSARAVEVKDGTFASVKPLTHFPLLAAGLEVFDLFGHILLPPLVDPHIHAYMNPWPLDPKARSAPGSGAFDEELDAARARLTTAHLAGIGLVRDLGDPHGINVALAGLSQTDPALPRVLAAGAAVYREGKYGRFIGFPVKDGEGLARAVRRLVDDPRIDAVKLIPTGIINFQKGEVVAFPQFSLEELRTGFQIAHDHGKAVVAHSSGERGIRIAVEAGVDFIEHGYFISKETMDLLREKALIWTPTFAPVQAQWNHAACCGWDAETTGNLRRILDGHAEMLCYAHSIGVCIMAGSDAGSPGVPHGGGLIRELELMEAAGLPADELLAMATTRAAGWILDEKEAGRIAPGRPADFIAVRGDASRRIGELRRVEWVSRNGRVCRGRAPQMETDVEAETYGIKPRAIPPPAPFESRPLREAATEGAG